MINFKIIIAFYNPKIEWFDRCLNSIIKNNYSNYEIIFVDDGSTNVNEINLFFKKIENKKIKYKLITIQHSGNSIAKKIGFDNIGSYGENDYLWFIDIDDTIPNDSMINLINFIKKNPCIEILNFKSYNLYLQNYDTNTFLFFESHNKSCKELLINLNELGFYKVHNLDFVFHEWDWSCCFSLYKISSLKKISNNPFYFGNNKYEDIYNTLTIIPNLNYIGSINKECYIYWRNNTQSISNTNFKKDYALEIINLMKEIIIQCEQNKNNDFKKNIFNLFFLIVNKKLILNYIYNLNHKEKKEIYKNLNKILDSSIIFHSTKNDLLKFYKNHAFNYIYKLIKKIIWKIIKLLKLK